MQFVNQLGLPEAGIDSGGLFKEFVVELCKIAFSAKIGLFKVSIFCPILVGNNG